MTPPPWDPDQSPAYVQMPDPGQLTALVAAAQAWTRAHPAANPAGVHLLSAWNEYDEGHFIGPVWPQHGGCARLDAIARVLVPDRNQTVCPALAS